jgi:Zn-dependent protease with chaperone function
VYTSGLKDIIWSTPLLKESSFLDIALGLSPFLLLLTILWSNAFTLSKATLGAEFNRKTYLLSHLRLNAPIFLPVMLFSLFQDLLKLFSVQSLSSSGTVSYFELLWYVLFMVFLMTFYPVVIRFAWACHPLPQGGRRKRLEGYCDKSGLTVSGIFMCTAFGSRSLTAGITGIIGKLRYLFITPGLLNILDDDEIASVIAHEAGHVRKKHMYYYVLVFLGFPLSFFLFSDLISLTFYGFGDLLVPQIILRGADTTISSLVILLLFAAFLVVYLRFFFGILSRNFERQADLFAFEAVGHPMHLISSFEKIARVGGHGKDSPNWHHFSIGQRIAFLLDCQRDKHHMEAHHKKVRRITRTLLALFIIMLLFLCGLNEPHLRKTIQLNLMEKQVRRGMAENPQSIEMQLALADILLEKKEYRQAEISYQRVIEAAPGNATALNNLAWLYATSEDTALRDKKRALALSQKAASIKQAPFILDTLAEAHFINGKREEALRTIEAAIALGPENLDYYLEQKQRFAGEKRQEKKGEPYGALPGDEQR